MLFLRNLVKKCSWSKSGSLLASGSDDANLIIHKYQPEDTVRPFTLATCLSTGHRANIFSVKFMPHSNDRTIISCAGDHQVRVFDLEYSGKSMEASTASSVAGIRSQAGRRNISHLYQGINYLSDGDANAKVYRSHSDRVKRIVTESSPYLFLTCSEDGEVRQFDLRLPSSAYPSQSSSQATNFNTESQIAGNAPPPLISYKKYHLDLNSISCSANQPHYIVLGGAHLHCFLHDRRMLGRDSTEERGAKANSDMGTATRCVRRFAPNGKQSMKPRDPGHVTACKISDQNPDEMIASWSGDHIYSFNLIQADDMKLEREVDRQKSRESTDRKQKRKRSTKSGREEDVVIRMRYENGQTEDFPVTPDVSQQFLNQARESVLTDVQKRSSRIGKGVVKICKLLFSMDHGSDLTKLKPVLSDILGICSARLPEIHEIMRDWSYPMNPDPATVAIQTTLRKHRDSSRRFLQACGVLVRILGGKIQTAGVSPLSDLFVRISISSLDHSERSPEVVFRYNFLNAIMLWLEGGTPKLITEFSSQSNNHTTSLQSLSLEDEKQELKRICDLLHKQAVAVDEKRVVSVANSRFETDELSIIFAKEVDAIIAFTAAVKIPFSKDEPIVSHSIQNKEVAMKYWGLKVCRGLLMNAGEGINFAFVDRAFGGLGLLGKSTERSQEHIDLSVGDHVRSSSSALTAGNHDGDDDLVERHGSLMNIDNILDEVDPIGGEEMIFDDTDEVLFEEENAEEGEHSSDDEHDDNDDEEEEEEEEEIDDDDDDNGREDQDILDSGIHLGRSITRSTLRSQVNRDLPCNSHIRMYQGHCNVKTVKDVNFFGLDDEYVVSGSDSGHIFIWDTKTSKLLNILQGDGEVVNVVQGMFLCYRKYQADYTKGHPYEPILAVSGIDDTIKIFSPDNRDQFAGRKGINLGMPRDELSGSSSLRMGRRRTILNQSKQESVPPDDFVEDISDNELADGGLFSRKRMHSSYTIMSQNEIDRRGGNREAFITVSRLSFPVRTTTMWLA